jgi:hypothetical protein
MQPSIAPGTWCPNPAAPPFASSFVNNVERPVAPERPGRMLNGWTVIWVGERAFRAPLPLKDQIESTGFLVKVYRSHDKCCRALDKKTHMSPTTVYVVSEVDAEPMLAYLVRRGARDLRFIVEASSVAEAKSVASTLACPEDAICTISSTWDEVMLALRAVSAEVAARGGGLSAQDQLQSQNAISSVPATAAAPRQPAPPRVVPMSEVRSAASAAGPPGTQAAAQALVQPAIQIDNPWTLIWISDQAFKPAAVTLKAQLEALGGQVKGYKTHKNAARALDKKRALTRTVVLVAGAEAAPFLAYMNSRPEISNTKVVVEATSRSVPIREGPMVEVVEDFETAIQVVQRLVQEPTFT